MTTALFVGRFQPFHNGHLSVIKKILQENDQLLIVIGSAQYYDTTENPLTAQERKELIESTLKEEDLTAKIFLLEDIHDPPNWVAHLNQQLPPYQKVYTGSDHVIHCFELANSPAEVHKLDRQALPISAEEIRKKILQQKKWEDLVPKAVAKRLKEWHIFMRLTNIEKTIDAN